MRLFTYGSLMQGGWAHDRLAGCALLGALTTEARFTLLDLGRYPGVALGGTTAIVGEVYAITAAMLPDLDDFEDVPELYLRETMSTPWGEAWWYRYVGDGGTPIPSGDWRMRPRDRDRD